MTTLIAIALAAFAWPAPSQQGTGSIPLLRHPVEARLGYQLPQRTTRHQWHEEHLPLLTWRDVHTLHAEIVAAIVDAANRNYAAGRTLFALWTEERDGQICIRLAFNFSQTL